MIYTQTATLVKLKNLIICPYGSKINDDEWSFVVAIQRRYLNKKARVTPSFSKNH